MDQPVDRADQSVDRADAFETVFRSEYRDLVGLAVLLVDDQDTAEEVVQDAFLKLYRQGSSVDVPKGFLRRCVVNGGRDIQRRRAVRRRHRPPVAEPSMFHFAELDDVLASLPFRQRAALVLRYVEDLPEADIADALGVRSASVRVLVRRGLEALRKEVTR